MTLQQLQYFQTLARVLHYTNASKELHISQPSLSYAINELEKELGISLFNKENHKIVLSPYGKAFLEYVTQALDTLNEGVSNICAMKNGSSGAVGIGYIYSLSTTLIPEIVEGFKKAEENDDIKFEFMQNLHIGLADALKAGTIDLALSADTDDDIVSVPIMEQELFCVVANKHPLSSYEQVTFEEIAKEQFVLLDQYSGLRQLLDKHFAKLNVIPHVISEAHECSAALQYVAHNSGITVIPDTPGINFLPVKKLKITTQGFKRQIYLSWTNTKAPMPPVRRVRNFIMRMFFNIEDMPQI